MAFPATGLNGTTTYSYPTNFYPNGGAVNRGYRLQCVSAPTNAFTAGNGLTEASLVGRTFSYATNNYTNFYCSVDMINWNDAVDQVPGLLGRIKDITGGPFGNGLGAVDGYAMTYETLDDGDGPGDRLGGALVIYKINNEAPVATSGGAGAASITLIVGHGYRLVFSGTNNFLTGQIYDLEDLTTPLVSVTTTDADYPSGFSGILSFTSSYNSPTDVTYDNYYADEFDPDVAIAPARKTAIAGTPQVVTRTPTNRFTNFHPPSTVIGFTVQTFTANVINASATKLYLNDVDVSPSLVPLPANGTTLSFTTAVGTLKSNTVYSARIEVQDAAGTLKSTNTFWFDTFSDAYLLSGGTVKTIEAEDYNYTNGGFQLDPIPVSGFDGTTPVNGAMPPYPEIATNNVGYADTIGTPEVDFHDLGNSIGSGLPPDYRIADYVGTQQGQNEIASLPTINIINNDNQRSQYAALNLQEYQVRRFDPGEWMNYTRVFQNTNYNVYLRVGTFSPTTVALDKVTSDPTVSPQTTAPLGTFVIPNLNIRSNYRYIPLTVNGTNAVVNLSGTNTVRLTSAGVPIKDDRVMNPNYILFVPAVATIAPTVVLLSSGVVTGPYTEAAGASVNSSTKTITVPLSGSAQFYRIRSASAVNITSISRSGGNIVIIYN